MEASLISIIALIEQFIDLIIALGMVGAFALGFNAGEGINS